MARKWQMLWRFHCEFCSRPTGVTAIALEGIFCLESLSSGLSACHMLWFLAKPMCVCGGGIREELPFSHFRDLIETPKKLKSIFTELGDICHKIASFISDMSLSSRTHILKTDGLGGLCLWTQPWGGRDRRIPGLHWPAGLAYLVSPRSERNSVSRNL